MAGNGVASPRQIPGLALAWSAISLPTAAMQQPVMEAVNAPARIVRVAEQPGTGGTVAWAFGYTRALGAGWQTGDSLGQVVFLKYQAATGWQIAGPPLQASGGALANPHLSDLALAPDGEGWAVGADGRMVHLAAGDSTWRLAASPVTTSLQSVSLTGSAGGVTGYAVGDGFTVLCLLPGRSTWQSDLPAVSTSTADLASVSAVPSSGTDAWAVSGDSSKSLQIFHRSGPSCGSGAGTWSQVSTGERMFDGPMPPPQRTQPGADGSGSNSTTENQAANGGAVAAVGDGAWIVGRIDPIDANHPFGDAVTGDASRPFAISMIQSGSGYTATSYCPATDTVSASSATSAGSATQQAVCDQVFPLAAFGLTGVALTGDSMGGEAYAGGMGLFHFVGGHWVREPDAVGYLSSLSLASGTEGWMVGTGSNAVTGAAVSQTLAIGHWTERPDVPAIARWPEPLTVPLEGVAIDPGGSGQALAVGDGVHLRYVPGFGWVAQQYADADFHAIAWPSTGSAWAVGNQGWLAHWDGHSWTESRTPLSGPTDRRYNLYGVAFSGAGTGWAVGDAGTIFDYSGGSWHRDQASGSITRSALYTVTAIPGGAMAAGADGTVLVLQNGAWHVAGDAELLAQRAPGSPTPQPQSFFAAADLSDGTAAIAGTGGVILLRSPGGQFVRVEPSIDAMITALALERDGSGLHVVASVSPRSTHKYVNSSVGTTEGWVFVVSDPGGHAQWRDIEMGHQLTMWQSTDTAAQHDPVLALAIEPGALRGWAVGGYPAQTLDDDNTSYEREDTSASTYRVDVGGDPQPPASGLTQLPPPPKAGFSFAFLGDSACAAGVCGADFGSGAMSDVILQEAQSEINQVAPSLTIFGGNMRRTGLPEELQQFQRLMAGWQMPVYAAIGNQDLVAGVDTGQSVPGAPNAPSQASGVTQASATNAFDLQTFAHMPAPWGSGNAPAGVIEKDTADDGTPAAGEARSHYAFDYQPDGLPVQARFIVVDTGYGAGSMTTGGGKENPPLATGSTQTTWLQNQIKGAAAEHVPAIVVMNQPSDDPRGAPFAQGLPATDEAAFDSAMLTNPASAVFASHISGNLEGTITGTRVPLFVSGGAGSPLDGSRTAQHGYYHGWLLVTVNPGATPPVSVQGFPVLDSTTLQISAAVGSAEFGIPAGTPAQVRALGRLPDTGLANLNGTNPDPNQSRAQYMEIPGRGDGGLPCTVGDEGDRCSTTYQISPYHRFWSETPQIADFVKPCPSVQLPQYACNDGTGHAIPDDQDGFLCTYQPGTALVDAVIGIHQSRANVTVSSGKFSMCGVKPPVTSVVSKPTPPPPVPTAGPVAPNPQNVPVIAPRPVVSVQHHRPVFRTFQSNLVPALLPPPVPVLAGAPPLTAAGTAAKKEEEREKALEHSQEKGGHTHQAVAYSPANDRWDPRPAAVAGGAGLMMFILLSAWAASRRRPEACIDVRRWE